MTQTLVQLIVNAKTQADAEKLIDSLLTRAEIKALSQRLEIIRLLKAGVCQRDIARQLGVGIATVSKGSAALQSGHFSFLEQ